MWHKENPAMISARLRRTLPASWSAQAAGCDGSCDAWSGGHEGVCVGVADEAGC